MLRTTGGYPKHQTFGAPVGSRSAEGRDEFLAYSNAAVAIPSPATDRIGAIATETGVFLVVGIIERAGATLYCSVSFFSPEHGLVYTRRKVGLSDRLRSSVGRLSLTCNGPHRSCPVDADW